MSRAPFVTRLLSEASERLPDNRPEQVNLHHFRWAMLAEAKPKSQLGAI